MCNLYSQTKGQQAIIELTRALCDATGNLPMQPGIYPDYSAPIVRNSPAGERELVETVAGCCAPLRRAIHVIQRV